MPCKRYFVSGKVQGVWYRASTQEKAAELSLTGYARNLTDGRVEVMACGDDDQLNALERWLWEGPPLADVADVLAEDAEGRRFAEFATL